MYVYELEEEEYKRHSGEYCFSFLLQAELVLFYFACLLNFFIFAVCLFIGFV